jgi:hypothetical protein
VTSESYSVVASQHADFLAKVYLRSFQDRDERRFKFLWCEIAEACHVAVDELHENDAISTLCPGKQGWLSRDHRLDDLEYIILRDSRGRPPPAQPPQTIGDVIRYLLPMAN